MAIHYIILGSSYAKGERIALDIASTKNINEVEVTKTKKYLEKNCIPNTISTHVISTDSCNFDSVKKYDKYFENVKLIDTKEEFVELINMDRNLTGLEVAKYILTKVPCTHLKIQKLTYLCYADYLSENNKKLFEDKIYAYAKGPVIASVYNKYKKTKKFLFFKEVEDDVKEYSDEKKYLPIRSRILASEDGINKLASIDKTLEKYGKYSGKELVEITHKEDSPWNHSGSGIEQYKEIADGDIIKYHCKESI